MKTTGNSSPLAACRVMIETLSCFSFQPSTSLARVMFSRKSAMVRLPSSAANSRAAVMSSSMLARRSWSSSMRLSWQHLSIAALIENLANHFIGRSLDQGTKIAHQDDEVAQSGGRFGFDSGNVLHFLGRGQQTQLARLGVLA